MSTGLKKELGLGEPKPAGSTQQADSFKAAFQAEIGAINECLQYTAAHGEKEKHEPLAGKREKTCSAYQVALGRIDPTNPAIAQGAIDQVIAAVKGLRAAVETMKQAVEKAYNAWTGRESEFDALADKIREMVEWGHDKASALQQIVDAIASKANLRKYEEALKALEQLLGKVEKIYEEYLRQKAAQEEYDAARLALDPRLAEASTSQYETLAELDQQIADLTTKMEETAAAKDYVQALQILNELSTKVDEKLTRVAELEAKKQEYEQARADLDPRLAEASTCQYEALAELDQQIADLTTRMEEAVAAENYEQALAILNELSAKVDEKLTRVAELEAMKQEYEQARAALDPRLAEASTSQYEALAELDQQIADLTTRMDEAAAAEDYEQALQIVNELSTKVDEKLTRVAELEAMKDEYEAGVAALEPRLSEASVSEAKDADLAPIQAEMASLQTEMEAAAEAQDYENALGLLSQLEAKVEEYFAAIEEKKKEYEAARKAALAEFEKCFYLAHSYKGLKADQDALKAKLTEVDAAANAEDYEKAKQLADELKAACAAYMEKAKKEQEKYDQKAEAVTKELDAADDVNRQDVARKIANELKPDEIKHMPIEVRNRIMLEMQKGGFSEDDKKAMDNLYKVRTLDPEFEEAERVKREELIERMKSDPEFAKARENWKDMNKDQRLKIMEKAANLHAEVYGTKNEKPKITIEEYNKEPEKDDKGKVTSYSNGTYNHSTGKLRINTNGYKNIKFNDFDKSLDLATHETGHRYQNVLADRLKRKDDDPTKLKPGDPEYNQAVSFRVNDPRYGYYRQPGKPWEIYLNQPMEAHSRESGGEVQGAGIGKHDHDHDHEH